MMISSDETLIRFLVNKSGHIPKLRILTIVLLLLGVLSLLITASYAWFSISLYPRVSDMAVFINSPEGLLIAEAYDAPDEDWGTNLVWEDLANEDSPLKPVTWSEKDQCFKAIRYANDGRQTDKWRILNDEENAKVSGDNHYYSCGTFYAKTDSSCKVLLADAVELNDGVNGAGTYVIGNPVWNGTSHTDAGYGAQYAVRIGFKVVKVDPATGADISTPEFYIYEPNADSHADGTVQLLDTKSTDGDISLVPAERLIVQSTSSWEESNPVQENVTVKTLGKFTNEAALFSMASDEVYKVNLYVWIEGQDADCYGLPDITEIQCNIQFKADPKSQSGIQEIPEQ